MKLSTNESKAWIDLITRKYELTSLMNLVRLNMNSVELDAKQLADLFIASEMFSQEPLFEVAVEKLKGMMGVLEEVLEKMKDRPELIIKIFVARRSQVKNEGKIFSWFIYVNIIKINDKILMGRLFVS